MSILFETRQGAYVENCFDFLKNLWLTDGFDPLFSLGEHFDIYTCYFVTYQNIMSDTSTIIRYENVQGLVGNVAKFWLK